VLINENSGFLPTKIDEDGIAPQEISKDGCDTPGASSSEMESEGKSGVLVIVLLLVGIRFVILFR